MTTCPLCGGPPVYVGMLNLVCAGTDDCPNLLPAERTRRQDVKDDAERAMRAWLGGMIP